MLGLKLIRGGKDKRATGAVEKAKPIEPAESLFEEALKAEEGGNRTRAIELYRLSVIRAPGSEDAKFSLNNIGAIYGRLHQFTQAEFVFRQVVEMDPFYPLGLFNLGVTLGDLCKSQDAMGYYLRALSVKPDYGDAHYNLGLDYENARQYRPAYDHFKLYMRFSGIEPEWQARARIAIRRLEQRLPKIVAAGGA